MEARVEARTAELAEASEQVRKNLTERAQADEQIRWLAGFPGENPNPIFEVDLPGTLTYFNPIARAIFPDLPALGFQHPIFEGLSSLVAAFREEGKPFVVREVQWGDTTYEQQLGASVAHSRVRIYMRDVTERRQAEEALRRYTERLKTLQEIDRAILGTSSPEAIGEAALRHMAHVVPFLRASITTFDVATGEGVVVAVQPRGSSTPLGVGSRVLLSALGSIEDLRRGIIRTVDDPLSIPIDGAGSAMIVPLVSRGELIGTLNLASEQAGALSLEAVSIVREVADSLAIAIHQADLHAQVERHAGELEERVALRTEELESFSYSVSHDLRAPLRAIDAFSRLLARDYGEQLDAEGQRRLNIVRNSAGNMQQLIDDLLAFSRSVRQDIQFVDIDLRDLAASVFEQLKLLASDRNVRLTIGDLPAARGDRSLIRQVFENLLSNAIKFTRLREEAVIEIDHRVDEGEVVYFVRDNGVGFDDRYADRLFKVFQRLHSQEEFEGSGVGLAIVQRIIRRHRGRVWAEGRVNEGTTIYFTLPRPRAAPR
jgi:signal transduction histidine kinase